MATNTQEWQRFLLDLAEALCGLGETDEARVAARGRRVGDLAIALADAAAARGIQSAAPIDGAGRTGIRLAAVLHAFGVRRGLEEDEGRGRLDPARLAAIEYRLRWIREICRHRAITRSVIDGGGLYPPPDPSGLGAVDYALRASDVQSVLDFITRVNAEGLACEEDREWLGALARRRLETGEGPAVPYLTEEEHAALCGAPEAPAEHRRRRTGAHLEDLQSRLDALRWPEPLHGVPDMVDALVEGAGARASFPSRVLAVARACDALLHDGGPRGEGLSAAQALMQLRRDAEAGRLDRDLVRVLDESDLLPVPEHPADGTAPRGRSDGRNTVGVH